MIVSPDQDVECQPVAIPGVKTEKFREKRVIFGFERPICKAAGELVSCEKMSYNIYPKEATPFFKGIRPGYST